MSSLKWNENNILLRGYCLLLSLTPNSCFLTCFWCSQTIVFSLLLTWMYKTKDITALSGNLLVIVMLQVWRRSRKKINLLQNMNSPNFFKVCIWSCYCVSYNMYFLIFFFPVSVSLRDFALMLLLIKPLEGLEKELKEKSK